MATITGANATLVMTVDQIFPNGFQVQGFAVDDSFRTDAVSQVEVLMGVDGRLSAGFVFNPTKMTIMLQADSPSVDAFESVRLNQFGAVDAFRWDGTITLANGYQYNLTNGYMTSAHSFPDVKKVLQPLPYEITFESVSSSPL